MTINYRETSKECYHELLANGTIKSIDDLMLGVIKSHNVPLSRSELKVLTGLEHNLATHSVWSLLKKGLITELDNKMPCSETGRYVFMVTANVL